MLQLSKLISIFAMWIKENPRHRGERLSFDPSENLQNSKLYGKKSESCFSCSSIYTAHSAMESVHIYTCRCELIFILYTTGIAEPSDKECQEGSHSLCVYGISVTLNFYMFNN